MCGITVYISKSDYENDKIQNVSHRGPDNTNILKFKFSKYFVNCVFHRLAIIDVSHGNQPKNLGRLLEIPHTSDGRTWQKRKKTN